MWKQSGCRGVWLKIPAKLSQLMAVAFEHGFEIHHATKENGNYIMLTTWLSDEPNHMPHYATHALGVGCIVVNSKRQVLAIQENWGVTAGKDIWKLPGGAVDPGEELDEAAARECLEETGMTASYCGLLGFRHLQEYRHGHGDIYFLVVMKCTNEAQEPNPRAGEIAKVKWMELEEFLEIKHLQRYFDTIKQIVRDEVEAVASGKKTPTSTFTCKKEEFVWGGKTRRLAYYWPIQL